MIAKILAKIFGTQNERELKRLLPLVHQINKLEPSMQALTDEQLKAKTVEFRERVQSGQSLDSILPEAFAVVREASRRTMNMRHFDVQLIGGMVLHSGKISEMRTGEGKTLVATLALYLNALSGKGAHLITVNDYLARRDAEWMSPIYNFLGLTVGIIQNSIEDQERKAAYAADITYGTNNEFGFDYLRDNMKFNPDDLVQRPLNFAIVDEVDSILIDEARTPLIISGPSEKGSHLYEVANRAVQTLVKEEYEIDEKARSVHLTEAGNDSIERVLKIDNLYAPENILILHHVTQALRAHTLFKKDVDYVVFDEEVLIVDEFTGRVLPGRRYSDGLHQALEAKEGVKIERENQTLASITLQNYFRLYNRLSGMTGTAVTEAHEFWKIYKLPVIIIPTNRPISRQDQGDTIFLTRDDKYQAVIDDIKAAHKKGQPVLVGTIAIETSELLSAKLHSQGVAHNVLNAKQHEREADIIKEAGEKGRVTIATNMAGRGTDIKLGEGVKEAGGLRIIGTERHESRRIDNQLRGRAGRQGDPGSSKFYVSLEDDLMRIFGGDRLKKTMERLGMKSGESIEHSMVSRSIEKAQERVEKQNFDIRKHLLEYDDVLNQQRMVIYRYRHEILQGAEQIIGIVKDMIADVVHNLFALHFPGGRLTLEAREDLMKAIEALTGLARSEFESAELANSNTTELEVGMTELLIYCYEKIRGASDQILIADAEKWILLETIDRAWRMHLQNIDHLREGIGLRGYGQKNPLLEYKRESFFEFERMMEQIKTEIISHLFRIKPDDYSSAALEKIERAKARELESLQMVGAGDDDAEPKTVRRSESKVGRNDPCSCGSGKKYKHCCGKE
jgi:preprotein translocase subunit SecA